MEHFVFDAEVEHGSPGSRRDQSGDVGAPEDRVETDGRVGCAIGSEEVVFRMRVEGPVRRGGGELNAEEFVGAVELAARTGNPRDVEVLEARHCAPGDGSPQTIPVQDARAWHGRVWGEDQVDAVRRIARQVVAIGEEGLTTVGHREESGFFSAPYETRRSACLEEFGLVHALRIAVRVAAGKADPAEAVDIHAAHLDLSAVLEDEGVVVLCRSRGREDDQCGERKEILRKSSRAFEHQAILSQGCDGFMIRSWLSSRIWASVIFIA